MEQYCRVAVDSPVFALDRAFDYAIPARLQGRVEVGSVVRVPLHGRRVRAYVTELLDSPAVESPRPLSALVSPQPLFASAQIELARWVADRYFTTLGAVLHDAVPGRYSLPAPRHAVAVPPIPRPPWLKAGEPGKRESVCVVASKAEPGLVGYISSRTAAGGRQTLVICPRIDVAAAIGAAIPGAMLLHGEQRPADRAATWASAAQGNAPVVVGGRAALFVPLPNLATIVVASAHDTALRSERTPRLHALVVARERAAREDATFVATSPVPPLELMRGEPAIVQPSTRGGVRTEIARPRPTPITERLHDVIGSATNRGTDALVFVARLGGVLRARCEDCGWQAPAADAPDVCPRCGGRLAKRGWGHGRIASALERAGFRVVKLVRGDEIEAPPPEPVVVVGTLAAAHDWPRRPFGAVAVADADQLLGRQDFRAAERALGILNDLAAVLEEGGRFLVQTRESEHHAVQAFVRRSFTFFADRELPLRRETGYPPFGEVVVAETSIDDSPALARAARGAGARVIGPVEGGKGARLLIRAADMAPLLGPLREFASTHRGVRLDVDPLDVI